MRTPFRRFGMLVLTSLIYLSHQPNLLNRMFQQRKNHARTRPSNRITHQNKLKLFKANFFKNSHTESGQCAPFICQISLAKSRVGPGESLCIRRSPPVLSRTRRGISGWIEQHRLLSGFSKETVPNLAIMLLVAKFGRSFVRSLRLAVVTRAGCV